MDRLLMTVFMQRLGKSPDKFCVLLTEYEYVYFAWRQRVEAAVQCGAWNRVEELLNEPEASDLSCNPELQKQYFLMLQGIVQEKWHGNRAESFRLLEEAATLTVPGFQFGLGDNARLGVQEINIMLLWQEVHPDREKAFEFLKKLVHNIEVNYADRQEKCKIYPRAAARLIFLLNARGEYREGIALADRALRLVMDTGYGDGVEQVLRGYAEITENVECVNREQIRQQAFMWQELLEEYCKGKAEENEYIYVFSASQEIELVNEMISGVRRERSLTQEQLSKDICDTATLSRIENGKRRPARKNYKALAQRLSLPEEYYYGTISTDRFEVLEQRWEYEACVVNAEWEKAEGLRSLLAEELNRAVVCNRQYLEQADFILEKHAGKIKLEDSFDRLRDILKCTIPKMPDNIRVEEWPEQFWQHVFTEREMSLLLQVSDVLAAGKKHGQAVFLLEKMLEYYGRSKVNPEFHYRIVLLIYGRLSSHYGILNNYELESEYAEKGVRLCIQKGAYKSLPKFLNNKADGLENQGLIKEALYHYKAAFIVAKVLLKKRFDIAARSYKKLSGIDLE